MSFEVIATGATNVVYTIDWMEIGAKKNASMHNGAQRRQQIAIRRRNNNKNRIHSTTHIEHSSRFQNLFFHSIYSELMQQIPSKIRRLVNSQNKFTPIMKSAASQPARARTHRQNGANKSNTCSKTLEHT